MQNHEEVWIKAVQDKLVKVAYVQSSYYDIVIDILA